MGANHRAGLAFLVCICLISLIDPAPAAAQADVEFTNVAAFVEFGKSVTFQAVVTSETQINGAILTINPLGSDPLLVPVIVDETGGIVYQMDTTQNSLRAFTPVTYA